MVRLILRWHLVVRFSCPTANPRSRSIQVHFCITEGYLQSRGVEFLRVFAYKGLSRVTAVMRPVSTLKQ